MGCVSLGSTLGPWYEAYPYFITRPKYPFPKTSMFNRFRDDPLGGWQALLARAAAQLGGALLVLRDGGEWRRQRRLGLLLPAGELVRLQRRVQLPLVRRRLIVIHRLRFPPISCLNGLACRRPIRSADEEGVSVSFPQSRASSIFHWCFPQSGDNFHTGF